MEKIFGRYVKSLIDLIGENREDLINLKTKLMEIIQNVRTEIDTNVGYIYSFCVNDSNVPFMAVFTYPIVNPKYQLTLSLSKKLYVSIGYPNGFRVLFDKLQKVGEIREKKNRVKRTPKLNMEQDKVIINNINNINNKDKHKTPQLNFEY